MEITFLASSSKGNCALVESDGEILVIDCGIPLKDSPRTGRKGFLHYMADLGKLLSQVKGILVSHGHSDHAGKAGELSKALHVPLFCTSETVEMCAATLVAKADHIEVVTPDEYRLLGNFGFFAINTYHTPGAVGFVVTGKKESEGTLCIINDCPEITEEIGEAMARCNLVAIETDYSEAALTATDLYNDDLKNRIRMSHLSNEKLIRFLSNGFHSADLRTMVLIHLSLQTNLPFVARAKVQAVLKGVEVVVAPPEGILGPITV